MATPLAIVPVKAALRYTLVALTPTTVVPAGTLAALCTNMPALTPVVLANINDVSLLLALVPRAIPVAPI